MERIEYRVTSKGIASYLEKLLMFIERATGKHIHYFIHPSKLIYPNFKLYQCRCGKVAQKVQKRETW
ncbi:hypothetical protein [Paenibacillus sp. SN-8-1]|uniref:hypothetical protein n=1 Tax=Paenibacillus sp. SN-8-1 TaxID=3435409 RepID=UPI003D9A63AE